MYTKRGIQWKWRCKIEMNKVTTLRGSISTSQGRELIVDLFHIALGGWGGGGRDNPCVGGGGENFEANWNTLSTSHMWGAARKSLWRRFSSIFLFFFSWFHTCIKPQGWDKQPTERTLLPVLWVVSLPGGRLILWVMVIRTNELKQPNNCSKYFQNMMKIKCKWSHWRWKLGSLVQTCKEGYQ